MNRTKRPLPEGGTSSPHQNVTGVVTSSTGLETIVWEKTLRISNIPITTSEQDLCQILERLVVCGSSDGVTDKRPREENILGFSLAPSPSTSDSHRYLVATVTFKKAPSSIGPWIGPAGAEFRVNVDTHFMGLTPLNNPSDPHADIISITGLGGHAFGSWRSRSRVNHAMWLRDILPEDLQSNGKSARVFTYGYDTTLHKSTSDAGIKDLSRCFLNAVNNTRSKQDPHRPIIFIAHSLGGLILKRALIEANGNFPDLLRSCYGMLFFGVPNKGLEIRGLMEMTNEQPNKDFICDLRVNSQFLSLLDDVFCQVVKPLNIKVISFYEEKDTKMVKQVMSDQWARAGEYVRMVTRESAISSLSMANEASDVFSLNADHCTMVKFDCRLDSNYQHVRRSILELIKDAPTVVDERFAVQKRGVPNLTTTDESSSQKNKEYMERRKKMLSWLSKLEPEDDHERIYAKRHQDTGKWFLESMEVQGWLEIEESSLLWCHGNAGVGKSVLTSILLEDIRSRYTCDNRIGIVFFYFNFQSEATQKPTDALSILLKQLCRYKEIPESLVKLYEECTSIDRNPRLKELQDQFQTIIGLFEEVFLVIDAMDECNKEHRGQLLPYISILFKHCSGRLKIFVTSRPEPDIRRTFTSNQFKTIQIEAKKVDEDIQIYVRNELEHRSHDYCDLNSSLRQKIEEALVSRSNGMFLWVRCQLDEIYRQPSVGDIIDCLQSLPMDMTETYTRILKRIKSPSQSQSIQTIAKRALIWVITAKRPLSPRELAIAVAIEQSQQNIEGLDEKYKPQMVIDSCCGLLTTENNLVRPIHFSAKEFLQSGVINEVEANVEILRSSISYILHYEISSRAARFYSRRLYYSIDYVFRFWHMHVRSLPLPLPNDIKSLLKGFFDSEKFRELSYEMPHIYCDGSVFALCASADLLSVYRQLYQLDSSVIGSVEAKEAVQKAAQSGSVSAITILFEIMKEEDTRDTDPFYLAVDAGQVDIVQFFINRGVDVNAYHPHFGSALSTAASRGDDDVVQKLIEGGADVNVHSLQYESAIQCTARQCRTKTIEILLASGANVDTMGGEKGNALQIAASKGYQGLVELLLAKGANPNFQGGTYGTPLQAAVTGKNRLYLVHEYSATIEILLKNGADPNIQAGKYGTALQAAAYKGYSEAVKILLGHGADVNIQGGEYGTALQAAASPIADDNKDRFSFWGSNIKQQDTIRILLSNGADVNAQCGKYGSALAASRQCDSDSITKLLLENGATEIILPSP